MRRVAGGGRGAGPCRVWSRPLAPLFRSPAPPPRTLPTSTCTPTPPKATAAAAAHPTPLSQLTRTPLHSTTHYPTSLSCGARVDPTHPVSACVGCAGQARVGDKTTVVSTSTRNFPNRLGKGANVYLASAELAAVAAVLGRLPTVAEYLDYARKIDATAADTYRYLNFDRLPEYVGSAARVEVSEENRAAAKKRLQAA